MASQCSVNGACHSRMMAINLRPQPCTISVQPMGSEKFVYERDTQCLVPSAYIRGLHLFEGGIYTSKYGISKVMLIRRVCMMLQ